MNPSIAVTGASGHIGNVICRMLAWQGKSVRAQYHTGSKSLEGITAEAIQGDILNPADLDRLLAGCTSLIHCAALISISGDPDGSVYRTNTEGTQLVLEAALRNGIRRMVHLSSVHAVEEMPLSDPFDENRPLKGPSAPSYDYSKSIGEQLVMEAVRAGQLEAIVIRPGSVVGPFDFKPSELGKALIDFYKGKIPILPEGGYDFVDVRDIATTVIAALDRGRSGEAYLATGKYYTMPELAQQIHQATGKKVPRLVLSHAVLKTFLPFVSLYGKVTGAAPVYTKESIDALKHGHSAMSHAKAASELDHSPRPLSESLTDFYAWQKSVGNIF